MCKPIDTLGHRNVAIGKPASQSSTYRHSANPIASKAVDGNTNGVFTARTTTHTNRDNKAWWKVDLQQEYAITAVVLYNRIDCCKDRLQYFDVILSDGKGNVATKIPHEKGVKDTFPFKIEPPINAQYVMVQLRNANYLQLAEVQVFSGKIVSSLIDESFMHVFWQNGCVIVITFAVEFPYCGVRIVLYVHHTTAGSNKLCTEDDRHHIKSCII